MKIKNAEKLISALSGQYPKARLHVDGKLFQKTLKNFSKVQIELCNLTVHGKVNLPNTSINVRGGRFDAPRLTVNNVDTPWTGFARVGTVIKDAFNDRRAKLVIRQNVGGDAINYSSGYMLVGGNVGGDAINELTHTNFNWPQRPRFKLGTLTVRGKVNRALSLYGGTMSVGDVNIIHYNQPGTLTITNKSNNRMGIVMARPTLLQDDALFINGIRIRPFEGWINDVQAFLQEALAYKLVLNAKAIS